MHEPKKYTEKRQFLRMQIQSALRFKVAGDVNLYDGTSLDFNAIGIRFSCSASLGCHAQLIEGAELELTLTPASSRLAPLVRQGQIVRIHQEQELLYLACRLLD